MRPSGRGAQKNQDPCKKLGSWAGGGRRVRLANQAGHGLKQEGLGNAHAGSDGQANLSTNSVSAPTYNRPPNRPKLTPPRDITSKWRPAWLDPLSVSSCTPGAIDPIDAAADTRPQGLPVCGQPFLPGLSRPSPPSLPPAAPPTSPPRTPRRRPSPSSTPSPATRSSPRPPSCPPPPACPSTPSATSTMSSTRRPSLPFVC